MFRWWPNRVGPYNCQASKTGSPAPRWHTCQPTVAVERTPQAIRSALEAEGADIVLVIGCSGPAANAHAPSGLAAAGEFAIHGIALRPGETTGLGHIRKGLHVILLPSSPVACLFGYEMLAGRAVRRLGGRNPGLPYYRHVMRTARRSFLRLAWRRSVRFDVRRTNWQHRCRIRRD
jgi:molybdopterin biosynthesis enzyme